MIKEMISTLKLAYKENPKEFIGGIVFFIGSVGFTYFACWIHANILK